MLNLEFSRKYSLSLISILLFLLIFISYDTYVDYQSNAGKLHIIIELLLVISSFTLFISLLRKYISSGKNKELELHKLRDEYQELKTKLSYLKKDIFEFVQINFTNWQLTKSEQDIALLLFKGCTGKEISEVRKTNYQTVRSQISNIYRKAGVKNHNQFMAILMEDLL